jgi:putative FmdB family regulatory protein
MPKYIYKCNDCDERFEVYHGMSEDQEFCVFCSAVDPHRVPQTPHIKREEKSTSGKVGDEVKLSIEENKDILKKARKKASKEYYRDDN